MLKKYENVVNCLAINEKLKFFLSGSDDKTTKMWFLENGRLLKTFFGH